MLNPDFRDMLSALCEEKVEFLIVGAYALAAHGHPRATGDIDIWIRASNPDLDSNPPRILHRFRSSSTIKITVISFPPSPSRCASRLAQRESSPVRRKVGDSSISGTVYKTCMKKSIEIESPTHHPLHT